MERKGIIREFETCGFVHVSAREDARPTSVRRYEIDLLVLFLFSFSPVEFVFEDEDEDGDEGRGRYKGHSGI